MTFLPTDKPDRGIVVFERIPYWGPELKRQLSHQHVLVRECRSIPDLERCTAEFVECIVIISLDAAPTDCLVWLGRQSELVNGPLVVVIASTEYAELEWTIRETRAAAFVNDEICGHDLARICVRLNRAATRPPVAAPFQG